MVSASLEKRDFSSSTASDTVLLQLQALFGPMLTSALHLVDKRDGKLSSYRLEVELTKQSFEFPFLMVDMSIKWVDPLSFATC